MTTETHSVPMTKSENRSRPTAPLIRLRLPHLPTRIHRRNTVHSAATAAEMVHTAGNQTGSLSLVTETTVRSSTPPRAKMMLGATDENSMLGSPPTEARTFCRTAAVISPHPRARRPWQPERSSG